MVGAGDLRGQKHLVTPSLDGLTDLCLAVEIALRRVEERQPGVDRSPEGGDGLIVFDRAERAAQGPSPEADDRHFRPVFTELARPHSNERSVFIVASRRGEFVRSRQPAIRLTIMESLPFDGKRPQLSKPLYLTPDSRYPYARWKTPPGTEALLCHAAEKRDESCATTTAGS